jgi:hypothetical protein
LRAGGGTGADGVASSFFRSASSSGSISSVAEA